MPLYMEAGQCPSITAGDLQQGIMPAEKEQGKSGATSEKSNIYAETINIER